VKPPPTDPADVDRFLGRRRRLRRAATVVGGLLVATVVAGNAWQHRIGGDDAARFDRRTLRVDDAVGGDAVAVVEPGGRLATVRLAGVAAPDADAPHWSAESRRALADRVKGRDVLVRLPPLEARAADGAVRAYLYLPGESADSVNEMLVAAGDAYADRRADHPYRKGFEQAESEARRKGKGLWKDVRDEQQPAWRQAWLRGLREASRR
jgi:endonuclease YncB( thermonuclease family)